MKKKLITSICLCGLTLTLFAGATDVSATDFDQMIQQKNNEIHQLRTQRQTVQQRITDLTNEIATINQEAQGLLAEQEALYTVIDQLAEDIAELQVRIDKRAANIEEQARETQVNGKSDQLLHVVLDADSISDFVGRLHAMTTIVRANNQLITQQKLDQEDLARKQSASKDKVAVLHATQSRLEAQKGEIEGKQADLNVEVSTLAYQESSKEDEKQQLKAEKEVFEAEQARIREEAAQAAARQAQIEAAQAEQETSLAVVDVVEPTVEEDMDAAGADRDRAADTLETVQPAAPADTPPVDAPEEAPAAPAGPTPTPEPVVQRPAAPTPAPAPAANGSAIVAEAYKHIGKPYVWGGKGPDAFDCSGFTRYVYLQVTGRDIGGWTVPQESAGRVISVGEAQAGDLLFWGSAGSTHHVAIALGGGQYIHAPRPGQTISVGSTSNWAPSFAVRVH
ncbi:C40 family peptidase [Enterococcus sp. N342-3-1-2]